MNKLKKIETYKNLILDVPGIDQATYQKSVESSVTTSWGVNWDSDYIARDILQNFRDSNLSEIEKVVVNTKNDKILVIDDDQNTRDILSRMLKDANWIPITAKDGKDGLKKIKQDPAMIVLDLEMPRMDGFEFLDEYMQLYNKDERKPILVYSGKDLSEVQRDILEKNVTAIVKKDDVSIEDLSNVVKKIYKKNTTN